MGGDRRRLPKALPEFGHNPTSRLKATMSDESAKDRFGSTRTTLHRIAMSTSRRCRPRPAPTGVYGPDVYAGDEPGRLDGRIGWPEASTRTHAGRTPRCTGRSSGRCGSSPGSGRPRTRTPGSKSSLRSGSDGLSVAFDLPTLMGATPTTRDVRARSESAASRSTPSPTWRTSSRA